jgi:hypothetical protein
MVRRNGFGNGAAYSDDRRGSPLHVSRCNLPGSFPLYDWTGEEITHTPGFEAHWSRLWKDVSASSATFAEVISYAVRGRRFFFTDTGYIGLGPESAQEGDEVCMLEGGRVSYVIWEVGWGGGWELVGKCFVAGVMHGEFVDQAEGNGVEWQSRMLV